MKLSIILPTVMMYEAFAAGLICAYCNDWNMAGYWICGAGITYFVLRMN
jgi:hypothetical protein